MVGRRFRESIFVKLFFTVIFTTVLLKCIFFASLKMIMRPHIENNVKNVFVGYSNVLFEDVGSGFDSTVAREIAEKAKMIVIYKDSSTGEEWSSNPDVAYFPREFNRFYVLYDDEHFGFRIGRVHARVYREGGEYLLVTNMKNAIVQLAWIQIMTPFLGIIIVAVLSLWLLRNILKPVKEFMIGADKFGAGKFDYRIKVNRNDEFGKLAENFNNMGEKLSQLVEQKEQLIRDISHEMKTPITRSTMALEFLPDSDFKERISSDLKELNKMITEILETERLRSSYGGLTYDSFSLEKLLSAVISEYKFKSHVPITKASNEEAPNVMLDKERIRLVLSNIIGNALKYSSEDGEIHISTHYSEEMVLITVKDSGIGIEESELEQIFEPFYRVDKARSKDTGGYGLGLHLCKKIIEAHHGRITVESIVGEGTTVQVELPGNNNKEI